jgi:hypothetical protein
MYHIYHDLHEIAIQYKDKLTTQPPKTTALNAAIPVPNKPNIPKTAASKTPYEEAAEFVRGFAAHKDAEESFTKAMIADKGAFKDKQPRVQDEILRMIAHMRAYGVLDQYLTEECLGKERNEAFINKYGMFFKSLTDKDREKLMEIFANGFGSTAKNPVV